MAQRYTAIADRLAALGAERGFLRLAPARTAAEEVRLAELEADLTAANWAFQQFLADVQAELGRAPLVQEKLFHLRETQGLMADLRDTQPGLSKAETLHQAQRQLLAGPGSFVTATGARDGAPEHTRSAAAPQPPLTWNPQVP